MNKFFHDNPAMGITAVIARNLNALIYAHPYLDTSEKVAAAAGVGYGTVRRTRKAEGNVTVQNLELIARAFHRQAIDLMTEPSAIEYRAPTDEPVKRLALMEPSAAPPEERLLLRGYRAASEELRDVMLEVARRAVAKQEHPRRSDHQ